MDWNKLRIFYAAAEAGSFTRAGESLSLSQSAVSRQVGALEAELGVALFHRHARGLELTEQGEALYRTAHEVSSKLAMAEAALDDARDKAGGSLKITTTVGFGSTWLTPRIGEFLNHYPEMSVDLVLDDRMLDLSMREADIAVRMRLPTQPDLVRRRLLTVHNHLYASPQYLAARGTPQNLSDLVNHRVIAYGEDSPPPVNDINWILTTAQRAGLELRPILSVNNVYGLLLAVESGLGIAALPDYMVQTNKRVAKVLPDIAGRQYDAYFVYPEELRESKRIAVFRDFLLNKVADWQF
jgi:DNA-binding transcriptional LysR family regulator